MIRYGFQRLALVNSAGYQRAELPLDAAVSLIAPTGVVPNSLSTTFVFVCRSMMCPANVTRERPPPTLVKSYSADAVRSFSDFSGTTGGAGAGLATGAGVAGAHQAFEGRRVTVA